jgi:L-alanine-DL-glutamate epimerase-like enolase superfamily enzyme
MAAPLLGGIMTLRFTRLELREVKIPFRFSFKHALATRREAHNLILTLHTDAGTRGFGEVIPRPYLTGESIASAWEDIISHYWPAIRELRLKIGAYPREALHPLYLWASEQEKTAAYAGVDLAVWDAWARTSQRPGYSLFGQSRPLAVPLTGPLGEGSFRYLWRTTCIMKALGFQHFKVKVGNPRDLPVIRLVRQLVGPRCDLRVDANGGWDVAQAIQMAAELRRFNVSSVEQPIPAGNVSDLARVQQEGGLPVMADESLCTLEDARTLLAEQAADIWNLRLAKVGGFTGMLAILELAGYPLPSALLDQATADLKSRLQPVYQPKMHLGVLVGETALISAAARACLGLCPYLHVEYGYPKVLLKINPFQGDPGGYSGTGRPLGEAFGLGVSPKQNLLDKVTVRREVLS